MALGVRDPAAHEMFFAYATCRIREGAPFVERHET